MYWTIAAAVVLAAVLLFVKRRAAYYGRLLSDLHYREVFDWVGRVVNRGEVPEPKLDNGSALLTSAGLVLAFTKHKQEEKWLYHFSVSEHRGYTTRAVGSRMLFLILTSLRENNCEGDLYFTQTTVGHLALLTEASNLKITDYETVSAAIKKYRPMRIATRVVETQAGSNAERA